MRRLICRFDFTATLCLFGLLALPAGAVTLDHAVTLSYLTGYGDVVDWYDSRPSLYSETDPIPIGLAYNFTANFNSGFRLDAGLGPIAMILGDIDYYDVPLRFTAGFTILPSHTVRPYGRLGFAYHIADGDYMVEKPGFGLMGAVGLEIGRRGRFSGFLEVSYDTAKATFEDTYYGDREEIKVHGVVISLGVVF